MHKRPLKLRFIEDPAPPSGELGTPPAGGGAPAATPPADAPKTFTQDDLTRVATKEKQEGKAAAERELAEQLGVPLDQAKQIIADARAKDEATKTEAQKDRDAAAREKSEAEAEKAVAKQEVHDARLERAFAKEGLDLDDSDEKVKRLVRLVSSEVGSSYEDILAEVKTLKTDFPALFGEEVAPVKGGKPPKAPNGDPKGNPPKPTGGEDKFTAGAERAKSHGKSHLGIR